MLWTVFIGTKNEVSRFEPSFQPSFAQTESLITQLMGKGEAAARRELMELHGDDIEVDI